ncbi:TraR/DksA family transcriptional regulator [Aliikangiella sp. IMCC44359]|uniref:TraR/DksA family transcriptional regulator n=1 Tax=Aliikangiella sp. IMCC44359 TaxID=3459125 RepID=UPI00403A9902
MQDFEYLKKELEARQTELEQRIKNINIDISHTNQPLSKDWSEQATERENEEVLEALGIASQEELKQVKMALQRLKNGSYQTCKVCSKPIPFERLQLIPHTAHCTRCGEEIEATS